MTSLLQALKTVGAEFPFSFNTGFQTHPQSMREMIRIMSLPPPEIYNWKRTWHYFSPNDGYNFAEECQGLTNDGQYWYISCKNKIVKAQWNPGIDKLEEVSRYWAGALPQWRSGEPHFGDVSYYNHVIFVPLERKNENMVMPILLGFSENLELIGWAELTGNTDKHAAWCAVNPWNELLYTSHNYAYGELLAYDVKPFYVRRFLPDQWNTPIGDGHISPVSKFSQSIILNNMKWNKHGVDSIQGGAFSPNGRLYLTRAQEQDSVIENCSTWLNYLYCYDMLTGVRLDEYKIEYPYSSEWGEELEGLTMWDLPSGKIHIAFLNNNVVKDSVLIIHYSHKDPNHPL